VGTTLRLDLRLRRGYEELATSHVMTDTARLAVDLPEPLVTALLGLRPPNGGPPPTPAEPVPTEPAAKEPAAGNGGPGVDAARPQ